MKHGESNILVWNKHFESGFNLSLTLYSLDMFITLVVGSVCPKQDLLVTRDLIVSKNEDLLYTKVFPQQPISNLCQFYDKVCGSTADLTSHIRVYGGNCWWKRQVEKKTKNGPLFDSIIIRNYSRVNNLFLLFIMYIN